MAKLAAARPRRRIFRYALWAISTTLLGSAAFAVTTPYLLTALGHLGPNDWGQLSNEGQAYGGIAAVIGMLAITGVAVSLVLQAREAAVNRTQVDRASYENIVQRSLDDPDLIACWGPLDRAPREHKQHIYTNMIVSYWNMMFRIGQVQELELRSLASHMFTGIPGRKYWEVAGPPRRQTSQSGIDHKFVAILDEEYRKAVPVGPPTESLEHVGPLSRLLKHRSAIYGIALGAVCGTIIAAMLGNGRRDSLVHRAD
jgi:hypothetical protein